MRSPLSSWLAVLALGAAGAMAAEPPLYEPAPAPRTPAATNALALRVDAGRKLGAIRALQGVNGGPLCLDSLVDLTKYHQALGIPATRVHDANWPRGDVVDIHAIFPLFSADANDPANYRFAPTDDYLLAVVKTGAQVMYRLGESIELSPRKYYAHEPADYDQWARICLGIIRHYNAGWSGGYTLGLRYFEIWNEVEIGKMMWSGPKTNYYRLYGTAARAIKARYPALKIGGPAAAGTVRVSPQGEVQLSRFVRGFLDYCQAEAVPLDFFTWHQYGLDPAAEVPVAKGLRRLLDREGFAKTELHFNEWNYLPGGKMDPLWSRDSELMTKFFAGIGSMTAAAYDGCMLIAMQDTPVDMMNYYSGDNGLFGLFTRYGRPKKPYYAFLAFKALVDHPARVAVAGGRNNEGYALAGLSPDGRELAVLVSNYMAAARRLEITLERLPWSGAGECELRLLDETHNLDAIRKAPLSGPAVTVVQDLPAPGVLLLLARPR